MKHTKSKTEEIVEKRRKWRARERKRNNTHPDNYIIKEDPPLHAAKKREKERVAKFFKDNPEALEMKLKECRICKESKPITDFYLRADINTFRTECRPCQNKIRSKNRTTIGSGRHCYVLLRDARKRSRAKGMRCDMTKEELAEIISDTCPVLGIKLEVGGDSWQNSPSLDRIDNTKGYVKGNVIMVSHLVNTIKNKATPSQIKKVANFYMKLYKEKGLEV